MAYRSRKQSRLFRLNAFLNLLVALSLIVAPLPATSDGLSAPAPIAHTTAASAADVTASPSNVSSVALAASVTITLTASGFTPSLITTTNSTQVTWYNATGSTHIPVSYTLPTLLLHYPLESPLRPLHS